MLDIVRLGYVKMKDLWKVWRTFRSVPMKTSRWPCPSAARPSGNQFLKDDMSRLRRDDGPITNCSSELHDVLCYICVSQWQYGFQVENGWTRMNMIYIYKYYILINIIYLWRIVTVPVLKFVIRSLGVHPLCLYTVDRRPSASKAGFGPCHPPLVFPNPSLGR